MGEICVSVGEVRVRERESKKETFLVLVSLARIKQTFLCVCVPNSNYSLTLWSVFVGGTRSSSSSTQTKKVFLRIKPPLVPWQLKNGEVGYAMYSTVYGT